MTPQTDINICFKLKNPKIEAFCWGVPLLLLHNFSDSNPYPLPDLVFWHSWPMLLQVVYPVRNLLVPSTLIQMDSTRLPVKRTEYNRLSMHKTNQTDLICMSMQIHLSWIGQLSYLLMKMRGEIINRWRGIINWLCHSRRLCGKTWITIIEKKKADLTIAMSTWVSMFPLVITSLSFNSNKDVRLHWNAHR